MNDDNAYTYKYKINLIGTVPTDRKSTTSFSP